MSFRLNLFPGLGPPPAIGDNLRLNRLLHSGGLISSPSVGNLINSGPIYDLPHPYPPTSNSNSSYLLNVPSPHSNHHEHDIKSAHEDDSNHRNITSNPLATANEPSSTVETPTGQVLSQPTTPSSNNSGNPAPSKTQTVFIHKLYDMLEDSLLENLIWWAPPKFDSFCIQPGEDFLRALGQYFKHANASSFIRQLNMYGFHKVNELTQDDENNNNNNSNDSGISTDATKVRWEFRHLTNQFRKGDTESLKHIKRRSLKNINSHKEIVNLKLIPTSRPEGDYVEFIERSSYPFPPTPNTMGMPNVAPHPLANPLPHTLQYGGMVQAPHTPIPGSVPGSVPGSAPVQIRNQPPQQPQHIPQQPQPQHIQQQNNVSNPVSSTPNPSSTSPLEINTLVSGLNSTVQLLKAELSMLQQKYDALSLHFQKSNVDMVHLIEFIEKLPRRSVGGSISAASNTSADKSDRIINIGNTHSATNTPSTPAGGIANINADRNKARTPISMLDIPPDATTSPLLKNPGGSYEYELSKLKLLVLQRSHLTQRNSSTLAPIVPQPYPLNPHYTIHHHLEMNANKRHLLVLMDPLQPAPNSSSTSNNHKVDIQNSIVRKSTASPLLLPFGLQEAKLAPGSILFLLGPPRLVPPADPLSPGQTLRSNQERPPLLPLVLELGQLLKNGSLSVYLFLHSSDRPVIKKSMLDDEKARLKRRRI